MTTASDDRTTDLIRWAVFTCLLVPVVLLWYGSSLAGATGTALGLAAVTAACRLLLRRSERCAARSERCATRSPVEYPAPHTAQAPHRGRSRHSGTGCHRGSRHSGGTSPVD
ncbi:hypothetical protein ACIQPQ_00560 [Streptomyces sp. NPDC091281]|uniref:hypothetical protein n=1 Tax=Streptomyces sp. NPDC091281 TaxID=3365985 RepID=UPI003818F211